MDKGLPWYKRDPRAMIDAKRAANSGKGLTARQAAVYDLVIDLIYEGGGVTPNNPQHFASHFSDMGSRAARQAVEELLWMGKLSELDGMLHNQRAENEARKREKLSKARAEAGAIGGQNSSETRRKLVGNSSETERERGKTDEFCDEKPNEINKSAKQLLEQKSPKDKERDTDIGDGGRGEARSAKPKDPTERELLLVAMGHDASGVTATGRLVGNQGDMVVYRQWRDELGLSWEEVLGVISEVRHSPSYPSPGPFSFKFFNSPMQRLAGQKTAPALQPEQGNHHVRKSPQADRSLGARVQRLRGASLVPDEPPRDE